MASCVYFEVKSYSNTCMYVSRDQLETEHAELCERRLFDCSPLAKPLIAVEAADEKAPKSPVLAKLLGLLAEILIVN